MKVAQLLRLSVSGIALLGMLAISMIGIRRAQAATGTQSELTAITGQGRGHISVSSTAEDQGTFTAQITLNIHDAQPNTTFRIQRAPDLLANGVCSGSYIPFAAAPLMTSEGGAGATHFDFHRGAPFVSGTSFDVVFQAVGSDGSILQSQCMTLTVK